MNRPVLVLDFGAQYAQLIARRVRELGVYAEILPVTASYEEVMAKEPGALILSGGPDSVYREGAPAPDRRIVESGVPVLGICYGMQWLAYALGGRVDPGTPEYGPARAHRAGVEDRLLEGVPQDFRVWMSHGDRVEALPPGFALLLQSEGAPCAAMGDPRRDIYAVQFHPEVVHTEYGREILRNFLFGIAGLEGGWNMGSFLEREVERIQQTVQGGSALVALSGGVDSAVAAAIVQRAIGERLTAVFVDHGLLRKGEGDEVERAFAGRSLRFIHVRAQERFLAALRGVTDPEEKRKKIGNLFIRVFEEEAAKLGPIDWLVQGTLYPDVVESGPGKADVIKSHHNVGGLPDDLRFRLLEPLRELFKDEVRALGEELGLPRALVRRQPFPGPGLAIRMVGEVQEGRLALLRDADAVVRREIERAGADQEIWQWFAVLPGVRTVGVQGDHRTYGEAVVVRAVSSEDGMTADWAKLSHDLLQRIASAIVSEVPGINRVLYDITSKPPGTIEWE